MVYNATNSRGQRGISEQMGVPMKVETKWPYNVFEFKGDDKSAAVVDYIDAMDASMAKHAIASRLQSCMWTGEYLY